MPSNTVYTHFSSRVVSRSRFVMFIHGALHASRLKTAYSMGNPYLCYALTFACTRSYVKNETLMSIYVLLLAARNYEARIALIG